jgi:hypothetical protein
VNLASKNGATPLFLAAAWQRDDASAASCKRGARWGTHGYVNVPEGSWDDFEICVNMRGFTYIWEVSMGVPQNS